MHYILWRFYPLFPWFFPFFNVNFFPLSVAKYLAKYLPLKSRLSVSFLFSFSSLSISVSFSFSFSSISISVSDRFQFQFHGECSVFRLCLVSMQSVSVRGKYTTRTLIYSPTQNYWGDFLSIFLWFITFSWRFYSVFTSLFSLQSLFPLIYSLYFMKFLPSFSLIFFLFFPDFNPLFFPDFFPF